MVIKSMRWEFEQLPQNLLKVVLDPVIEAVHWFVENSHNLRNFLRHNVRYLIDKKWVVIRRMPKPFIKIMWGLT